MLIGSYDAALTKCWCLHGRKKATEMLFISWTRRASTASIIRLLSFIQWMMGSRGAWITKPISGILTFRTYPMRIKEKPGKITGNRYRQLHLPDTTYCSMDAGFIRL